MSEGSEGPDTDSKTTSGGAILIAVVFVVACVTAFFLVAIGFGHQG